MELLDSHRLTGPNLIQDLPGAALEVALATPEEAPVIQIVLIVGARGFVGDEQGPARR